MGWGYQDCPDLKLSNRPVRTRMPGGVAGVPPIMEAPYADCDEVCDEVCAVTKVILLVYDLWVFLRP